MADEELPPEEVETAPVDAPESQEGAEEAQEEQAPPSLEDVASNMGWAPKENWRGDPDKWKPAHEFVQTTADINSKLSKSVRGLETRLDAMSRTSAAMAERAVAEERSKWEAQFNEAVEVGDAKAARQASEAIKQIETHKPQQGPAPEAQAFLERNTWMESDKEAAVWAQTRAGQLAEQGLSAAKQLEIVEREAKDFFPQHFKQPDKPKPAPLSKPGNRGGKPRGKSFATLPKEAQAEALDFEKRRGVDKEEFAKEYYAQMEARS